MAEPHARSFAPRLNAVESGTEKGAQLAISVLFEARHGSWPLKWFQVAEHRVIHGILVIHWMTTLYDTG